MSPGDIAICFEIAAALAGGCWIAKNDLVICQPDHPGEAKDSQAKRQPSVSAKSAPVVV
jgi:hypothetical protein